MQKIKILRYCTF